MRGSIVKRPSKYYIVYDLGMRWDDKTCGLKRNQKWEGVPPPSTRKHAEKLLAERLSQIHRAEFVEPTNMTFRQFMTSGSRSTQ